VDEATGEDLEHGKVGLLLLGGNQITRGYFPAEGTEGNFSGNMLKTGDMARIDEDGYLYVTDYHREFLISRDVIVSPGEIEKFLSQVEGVSEAAVIGLDTGQGDQKIVAVVVPASGKDVSIDRLREACESRLSKEKVPAEFYLRDSMPKSISGRTLKRILIEEQTLKK
jgi:long-chain acyl-CoA synthetase